MSRIDELLSELTPTGVRVRRLGDVVEIMGRIVQPSAMGEFPVTVYSLPSFDRSRDPEVMVGSDVGSAKTKIAGAAVLVAKLNPHIPRVWRLDRIPENAYCSPEFLPLKPNPAIVDVGFIYYFILSKMKQLAGSVKGSTNSHKRLQRQDFLSLEMPVPPLEVQREIVRMLDQFTQLETELKAELKLRRVQYEHFAGELLAVDEDVPRVKLGDVATIVRGASPRPIQQFLTDDPSGAPWIKIGDVPADGKYITQTGQRVTLDGAAKSRRVMPGDFVLSNSMSFGRPYISKIEGYIHDGWLAISGFEDSYVADYLYYLLRSNPVQEEFKRRAGAGTVQNLNAGIVRLVEIPLPPRVTQERVVALLDRFDTLVNDISIGIPAEIAARRKQYEHYRDKLLTFEEAPA